MRLVARTPRLAVLAVLVSGLLAGCGGGSKASSSSSIAHDPQPTAPTPAARQLVDQLASHLDGRMAPGSGPARQRELVLATVRAFYTAGLQGRYTDACSLLAPAARQRFVTVAKRLAPLSVGSNYDCQQVLRATNTGLLGEIQSFSSQGVPVSEAAVEQMVLYPINVRGSVATAVGPLRLIVITPKMFQLKEVGGTWLLNGSTAAPAGTGLARLPKGAHVIHGPGSGPSGTGSGKSK
ncbi:MAG: hypothetical protein ACYC91_06745 [Solirubrobacteraceae bacterium]